MTSVITSIVSALFITACSAETQPESRQGVASKRFQNANQGPAHIPPTPSSTVSSTTTSKMPTTASLPVTTTTVVSALVTTTRVGASTSTTTRPQASTTTTTRPQASTTTLPAPPINTQDLSAYAKKTWFLGIPIVSSASVSDGAHREMTRIIGGMLSVKPQLLDSFKSIRDFRVIIRGLNERTLDLSDVKSRPFLVDWVNSVGGDARIGGGFGCSPTIPITVVPEANLLRRSDDPWRGESVALHEFAHLFVSCAVGSPLDQQVSTAFNQSRSAGLWVNTYAGSNYQEYWAEGVQSYFNTNLQASPSDGIHNHVNTRSELKAYDIRLHDIIEVYFGKPSWTY